MAPLSEYLKQIEKALHAGDATECTYRPDLYTVLLLTFGDYSGRSKQCNPF